MTCQFCGMRISSGAKYCESCGAPLPIQTAKSAPAPQFTQPEVTKPLVAAPSVAATVSPVDAIRLYFANCFLFSGRSRRSEYWWAVLLVFLISSILQAILPEGLYDILNFALYVPTLALSIRRLHDVDRSGWYLLWGLLPVIGEIMLLLYFIKDSTPGENRFGPNPKYM